jgi:hypothetical protein
LRELRCAIAHLRIHSPCVVVQHRTLSQGLWIPGLRQEAHPGMTRRKCRHPDTPPHSRDTLRPSLQIHPPSSKRAQGRPGARCTRGLACKGREKGAHEHTGSAEAVRPSLRNGFNGLLRALLGDRLSCHRRRAGMNPPDLTPASGRQNHTTSPSALALFVKSAVASTASRPAFVTIASRPSFGTGRQRISR